MSHREMVPSDMAKIVDIDPHHAIEDQGINLNLAARLRIAQGPCTTIENYGKIQACGGVRVFWPGTGEAWLRLCIPAGPHIAQEMKEIFMEWADGEKLNRIQATTQAQWHESQRFLEWMGMKWEAKLHRYGPSGIDQLMYAWIRP